MCAMVFSLHSAEGMWVIMAVLSTMVPPELEVKEDLSFFFTGLCSVERALKVLLECIGQDTPQLWHFAILLAGQDQYYLE